MGENISKLILSKSNNFIDNYINKSLFFTATPKNTKDNKMYNNLTEITIDSIDYNIIDNINEDNYNKPICGPLVYEYSHMDGVSDNILNDFNIRVELYSENAHTTIFETISRAILETGNNRVLTFHSRSSKKSDNSSDVLSFSNKENQDLFNRSFYKILNSEFPQLINKYKKIILKGIIAETKNKSKILNEFDSTKDDELFILSSLSFNINPIPLLYESNNVLATYTSNGGSGLRTFGCDNGTPAEIVMTYTGGGCASYIFTGSSGIFLFQSVTPTCTPPATSCSTGITVQSSAATSTCPSPKVGDYVITININ